MATGFKSGGRKPGSKNKRTRELESKVADASAVLANVLGDTAFKGDAHTFLMTIYKDTRQDVHLRIDAAKAAVKFEKPALAAVEHKGEVATRYVVEIPAVANTPADWQQLHVPPGHTVQ